jgi:hypothetical protein
MDTTEAYDPKLLTIIYLSMGVNEMLIKYQFIAGDIKVRSIVYCNVV